MGVKALNFNEIQGMNHDIAPSKRTEKLAYEIKNMRITIEDNNTLFAWENEKGTSELPLYMIDDYDLLGDNDPLKAGYRDFKEDATKIESLKEGSSGTVTFLYKGGTLYIPSFVLLFYIIDENTVDSIPLNPNNSSGSETPEDPEDPEVTFIPVQNIILNQTYITLGIGEDITLSATVLPENATNKNLSWKVAHNTIATINNGKVTGKAIGSTIVKVSATDGSNISASCEVVVSAPQYNPDNNSISITPSTKSLTLNETFQLTPVVPDLLVDGETVYNTENWVLLWRSSDYSKVDVSSTGLVTCKTRENATVTISCYFDEYRTIEGTCIITTSATSSSTSLDDYTASMIVRRENYEVSSSSNNVTLFNLYTTTLDIILNIKWLETTPGGTILLWKELKEGSYSWKLSVNVYNQTKGIYPFVIVNDSDKTMTVKTLNLIIT